MSRNHDLAKAINYMLGAGKRSPASSTTVVLHHEQRGRTRAARVPLGRKAWLFCGSDRGGERAGVIYTLIQTAKLNDVDSQAWLAEVLVRIAEHPVRRLDELLRGTRSRRAKLSLPDYAPPAALTGWILSSQFNQWM